MKKFLCLLLSFIMVFTMVPLIISPAVLADDTEPTPAPSSESTPTEMPSEALADDPEPTPEPTPTETPSDSISITIQGIQFRIDIYPSEVRVYKEDDPNPVQTAPIQDVSNHVTPAFIPFNGTDGIVQMTNSPGFDDPERANFVFVPNGYPPYIFPTGTKIPLEAADSSLGLGSGYYKLGELEYTNGWGETMAVTAYRKMTLETNGITYEFNGGATLASIVATIITIKGQAAIKLIDLISMVFTANDLVQPFLARDVQFNSKDYTYTYKLIDPEGRLVDVEGLPYKATREVNYKSWYIEDQNYPDQLICKYEVYGLQNIDYYGQAYFDIGDLAGAVLSDYMLYGNHTCKFDDCSDLTCNICDSNAYGGHQYKWNILYDDRGYALNEHEQSCEKCGYVVPGSRETHSFTYTVDNDKCHKACSKCGLNYDIPHLREVWNSMSDTEESCVCSNCKSPDTTITRPHNLVECDFYESYYQQPITAEEVCLNGGCVRHSCLNNCGYTDLVLTEVPAGHVYKDGSCICDRCGTANHQYKWQILYDDRGYTLNDHEQLCEKCGYSAPGSRGPHTYTYTKVDSNTCAKTCTKCGLSINVPHTFSGCTDSTCNNNCGYDRGPSDHQYKWQILYDDRGYVLNDHEQLCEKCGYAAPGSREPHTYTYSKIDSNTCAKTCTKCGLSTNVPHTYSGCTDSSCNNNCGYDRGPSDHQLKWHILYDDRGYVLNDHEQSCEKCGYVVPGSRESHTNNYTFVDSNTCAETCSKCDLSTNISHLHDVWYSVSDTEEASRCSHCSSSGSIIKRGHTYSDSSDRYCNTCSRDRATASDHQYVWRILYDDRGYVLNDHEHYCKTCGYSIQEPHSYAYSWVDVKTSDTCKKQVATCSACGYSYVSAYDSSHNYSNCSDATCNDCGYNRGSIYGIQYSDGHVYFDCEQVYCNRCSHARTAPGHTNTYSWVDVRTADTCEKRVATCSVCGNSTVTGYDYSHNYSNNCTATTCNDCGYVRSAPGHTYSYSWVDVRTASTCEKRVGTCACGYSYVASYDYSHSYSDTCTDSTCNDCGYVRSVSHNYSSWAYSSSSLHSRTCSKCGVTNYANHTYSSYTKYSSSQHRRYCTGCWRYFYASHNWVYISGKGYYCSTCGGWK